MTNSADVPSTQGSITYVSLSHSRISLSLWKREKGSLRGQSFSTLYSDSGPVLHICLHHHMVCTSATATHLLSQRNSRKTLQLTIVITKSFLENPGLKKRLVQQSEITIISLIFWSSSLPKIKQQFLLNERNVTGQKQMFEINYIQKRFSRFATSDYKGVPWANLQDLSPNDAS